VEGHHLVERKRLDVGVPFAGLQITQAMEKICAVHDLHDLLLKEGPTHLMHPFYPGQYLSLESVPTIA
jgi:hypothetical protein